LGVLEPDVLARQGMTLDQVGALLALHPIAVEVHHAADTTLDAFRATASAALESGDRFVIVNFLRKAIGEQISGHISPLAAYDAKETDPSSWTSRATNIRRCGSRRPTCSAP
jgi:Phytochelatin synthase